MNSEEHDNLVGMKYQMLNFIDRGCFSSIYLGQNILNLEKVAIKIQNDHPEMLLHEATILNYLRRNGCLDKIPQMLWYGNYKNQSCLVMNYYNVCLHDVLFSKNATITRVDELNEIMIQMLLCLENIHKGGVIHRDIKPKNFMMHLTDETTSIPLHLIDFGMASAVMPLEEDDHSAAATDGLQMLAGFTGYTGNLKYMSWFVEKKKCPASKRDDMISIGYIYILAAIYIKCLPVAIENRILFKNTDWKTRENLEKILGPIMATDSCWRPIYEYLDYCYGLNLTEIPKYYLLLKIFER